MDALHQFTVMAQDKEDELIEHIERIADFIEADVDFDGVLVISTKDERMAKVIEGIVAGMPTWGEPLPAIAQAAPAAADYSQTKTVTDNSKTCEICGCVFYGRGKICGSEACKRERQRRCAAGKKHEQPEPQPVEEAEPVVEPAAPFAPITYPERSE